MKTKDHSAPLFITLAALALVCGAYLLGEATKESPEGSFHFDILDKLECITYDARVRMAVSMSDQTPTGSGLGTMFIDDEAIERVNDGVFSGLMAPAWDDGLLEGLEFPPPWPRFMYGQIIRELKAQGVRAIGFDIFFSELDLDSPVTAVPIDETKTNYLSSDDFFAQQIAEAGNIVLATEGELLPKPLFADGAAAIGNIASRNDYGVLRRVRAFGEFKVWHPQIEARVKILGLKLRNTYTTNGNTLVIPTIAKGSTFLEGEKPSPFEVPLHPNGNLKLTKDGDLNLGDDPDDMGPDDQPPFTMKRAWNLGITLAAMQLGLDLDKAVIEKNRVILSGTNGVTRTIPTDSTHSFYIDWRLRWEDIHKNKTPVVHGSPTEMLIYDYGRRIKKEHDWENTFTNRIVIIGSVATGNNLTDLGSTPLEEKTPLVTKHLNVANSILENRFIKRASMPMTILLILAAGAVAGFLTWSSKVMHASIGIAIIALIYVVGCFSIYIQTRNWIPIVLPVFGGLLFPHFCLVTYRVVFEQREQRHVKAVFNKVVAPEVVSELLAAPNLKLGGELREITVYFADVRGFTEFTDRARKDADEYVKKNNLSPEETADYLNRQAAETLKTVNDYLGCISNEIKKHKGTLDKYIGDCVMAFWGAPISQPEHAICAVRAAVDSQRAMYAMNQQRAKENSRRKEENFERAERGEELLTFLPLLQLGSGINSGVCTVGMMGSLESVISYTAFGVEVNLASRLEGLSGRGRIIVSLATYEKVKEVDPDFAATFVEQPTAKVKGIANEVRNFEVPWKESNIGLAALGMGTSRPSDTSTMMREI